MQKDTDKQKRAAAVGSSELLLAILLLSTGAQAFEGFHHNLSDGSLVHIWGAGLLHKASKQPLALRACCILELSKGAVQLEKSASLDVALDGGTLFTKGFRGIVQELRNVLVRARNVSEQHVYVAAESTKALLPASVSAPQVAYPPREAGQGNLKKDSDSFSHIIGELVLLSLWGLVSGRLIAEFANKRDMANYLARADAAGQGRRAEDNQHEKET